MSDKSGGETESVIGLLPPLATFLDIQDVDNMCRLCMATNESNSSLCMVKITSSYPNTTTPISQLFLDGLSIDVSCPLLFTSMRPKTLFLMLMLCCIFKIFLLQIYDASSEGMPNMVCVDCLAELHSYTNFKKRSLTVDGKLREIVAKKRKIAEVYLSLNLHWHIMSLKMSI